MVKIKNPIKVLFKKKFILWFNEIVIKDIKKVGGKNASLGEMYQKLTSDGINIPNGFAVTAQAYFYYLRKGKITKEIKKVLDEMKVKNIKSLMKSGKQIRELILKADFPEELRIQIVEAYAQLEKQYNKNIDVAVRSSATAEDLAEASFAGQQETYLNVRGVDELLYACKNCMASLLMVFDILTIFSRKGAKTL